MEKAERQKMLEAIKEFRLIDDTFFNCCIDGDIPSMEELLRGIYSNPTLAVKEMHTQEEVPNIFGRSVRFDVFARDVNDREYNVEVQRSDEGADARRARFNACLMDTMNVKRGMKWKDLPPFDVVFIVEHDVFGADLPIYHVERTIRELGGKRFDDKSRIIYVNAQIQDDTPLGRLMHDMYCKNPDDMYSKRLADRVRFFKSSEHRVTKMCEIMEKIQNEGIARGIAIGEARGEARGRAEGEARGRVEGEARFRSLVSALMAAGKSDDVIRATQDDAYCSMLYEKYHI